MSNANVNENIDYTYFNHFNGSNSIIDHFYVTENISDCINSFKVIHRGDNLSDHEPVMVELAIPLNRIENKLRRQKNKTIDWNHISESEKQEYSSLLDSKLNMLDTSAVIRNCSDVQCTNSDHVEDIFSYCDSIVKACVETGDSVFVQKSMHTDNKFKPLPGWRDNVEPFKQKALLWHSIWINAGKPKNGHLADIMRQTRARYHYAVRRTKRHATDLKNEKLAESLCSNKINDYWTEIKRIKGRPKTCSASIDSCTDDAKIAETFANKYSKLYNSVCYDDTSKITILNEINSKITGSVCDTISCRITVKDVEKAIGTLKRHKSDGSTDMISDHLIFGGQGLYKHISILLSAMLRHGVSPDNLMHSVMIPIPKSSKKNISDSDNYRAIALINSISKVIDLCIIDRYGDLLATNDLQFGFKPNSSTNCCTYMVKETIQYYMNNDSNVNAAVLDASKAFDRINFPKLFSILLKRCLPPCIIRLIAYMYFNQSMCVKWNDSFSYSFCIKNGVKQGGILSPILFCIYIDDLFAELKNSNIGCCVGNTFCGALGYADDLILLCPSACGLQKMLNICVDFAKRHDMIFNADKSKVIIFHKRNKMYQHKPVFKLGDITLEIVDRIEHLGHILVDTLTDDDDIKVQISKFNQKCNALLSDFKGVNGITRFKMLQTYCYSFYGCQLWNLNCSYIQQLEVQWRKACRKALNVPNRTHCYMLPIVCNTMPFNTLVHKRYVKFIMSCLNSNNKCLRNVCLNALDTNASTTASNVKLIKSMYSIDVTDLNKCSLSRVLSNISSYNHNNVSYTDKAICSVLRECIDLRDGMLDSGLSKQECQIIIENVATM